jgi:hypothetical protein
MKPQDFMVKHKAWHKWLEESQFVIILDWNLMVKLLMLKLQGIADELVMLKEMGYQVPAISY